MALQEPEKLRVSRAVDNIVIQKNILNTLQVDVDNFMRIVSNSLILPTKILGNPFATSSCNRNSPVSSSLGFRYVCPVFKWMQLLDTEAKRNLYN